MFSLSATAFLAYRKPHLLPGGYRPSFACGLFLRRMMRKSHSHDKRRCPQGSLQGKHNASLQGKHNASLQGKHNASLQGKHKASLQGRREAPRKRDTWLLPI
jgi:hypothetical protein